MLDVNPEGYGAQSLRQLLPQQNLFQLGGRSVLLPGDEDLLLASLVGGVRGLLSIHQGDGSSWLRGMDGTGGRR